MQSCGMCNNNKSQHIIHPNICTHTTTFTDTYTYVSYTTYQQPAELALSHNQMQFNPTNNPINQQLKYRTTQRYCETSKAKEEKKKQIKYSYIHTYNGAKSPSPRAKRSIDDHLAICTHINTQTHVYVCYSVSWSAVGSVCCYCCYCCAMLTIFV